MVNSYPAFRSMQTLFHKLIQICLNFFQYDHVFECGIKLYLGCENKGMCLCFLK